MFGGKSVFNELLNIMCTGIALALSELPVGTIEKYALEGHIFKRGGEPEVRFYFNDAFRHLPIFHEGQLQFVRWGSHRAESRFLPAGGWVTLASLKNGSWENKKITLVQIHATMGFEKGVWFRIRQGIQGILVKNEHKQNVAYMLCEQSSHYFHVMTRSTRMPVLIDERY